MANPTKLVKLGIAKIGTPAVKTIRLLTPATATATTLYLTAPLKDDDGVNIPAPLCLAIKYASGENKGYVENVTVTVLDSTGTQCTVVRGIQRTGSDYLLGDADLARAIPKDSLVEIVYTVQQQEMLIQTMRGDIATGGNAWTIGDETDTDKVLQGAFEGEINGMMKFDKDENTYLRDSGAWVNIKAFASHGTSGQLKEHVDVDVDVTDSSINGDFFIKGSTKWGNKNPSTDTTCFVKNADVFTPAYLTGAIVTMQTLETWQAVTDGSLRITVDGIVRDITGLNFASAGSMSGIATLIQTGIRTETGSTETVVWTGTKFVVSSANTSATSAITIASSVGSGTDISGYNLGAESIFEQATNVYTTYVLSPGDYTTQSFTATSSVHVLTKIDVKAYCSGSSNTVKFGVYVCGSGETTSGAVLSEKTITNFTTTNDWNTVTFDTPIALTSGVKYIIKVEVTGANLNWERTGSDGYLSNGTWGINGGAQGVDTMIKIYKKDAGAGTALSFGAVTPKEATSATPNKVVAISDTGYIDENILPFKNNIITLTAGEAIDGSSTPRAVGIYSSPSRLLLTGYASGGTGSSYYVRISQSFRTTPLCPFIESIAIPLYSNATTNTGAVTLRIYAGANPPTVAGTGALYTTTIPYIAGGYPVETPFQCSPKISITANTDYCVEIDKNGAGYSFTTRYFSSVNQGYNYSRYWNGSSWVDEANIDRIMGVECSAGNNNTLVACNATVRGKEDFLGFVSTNVLSGGDVKVQNTGTVSGFSGLIAGLPVYLSTSGGITQVSTGGQKIGIAVSSTQVYIEKGKERKGVLTSDYYGGLRSNLGGEELSYVPNIYKAYYDGIIIWRSVGTTSVQDMIAISSNPLSGFVTPAVGTYGSNASTTLTLPIKKGEYFIAYSPSSLCAFIPLI